jgi:hypothetical protein
MQMLIQEECHKNVTRRSQERNKNIPHLLQALEGGVVLEQLQRGRLVLEPQLQEGLAAALADELAARAGGGGGVG